jgi:hypothetical protein
MLFVIWPKRQQAQAALDHLVRCVGLTAWETPEVTCFGDQYQAADVVDSDSVPGYRKTQAWGWQIPEDLGEWVLRLPPDMLCDSSVKLAPW